MQWAHKVRHEGSSVAWYALDEHDNDPARFAAYLLGAFRRLVPPFPGLPDGPLDIHETLDLLLNTVAEFGAPVVLMLDDYHVIAEPLIHDVISRMCDYMPANMRLAMGTRADPPLQLARLRALGQVAEIRMADLRFTAGELREWLKVALAWSPSNSSVETLENATEGWAAALSLIVMNQRDADEETLVRQLTRYSQSRRHIFDYFAQEILEQQPEERRRFLLDTSVLDRLTPDLCRKLTDNPQAPMILDQLAQQSQFVISLSNTEPVYRYHHLFGQFLRQYLEMTDRKAYLDQHRQAAVWHAAHGSVVEAVQYALAAEEFDYAAALIERQAWPALYSRGEFVTLVRWQPLFSEAVLLRHPRLCLDFVRASYLSGKVQLAEDYMRLATEALEHREAEGETSGDLQAIAFTCQATLAAYRGDVGTGLSVIKQVNLLHSRMDDLNRMQLAGAEMLIRYLKGDVPEARRACQEALTLAEEGDSHWHAMDAQYYLAQLDFLAGDLDAAQVRCEELLEQHPSYPSPLIPLMVPLGSVLYQRDRLVEAETRLRDAISLAHQANQPSTLFFAHIALSDVLLARGAPDEALTGLTQARECGGYYQSPMLDLLVGAAEARVRLRRGELDRAAAWAVAYQQAAGGGYHRDYEDISLAEVWLTQDEVERALTLLNRIAEDAQQAGRTFYVMQARGLQALGYQKHNDLAGALAALEPALTLARSHGFVRVLVDLGRSSLTLLRRAVERGVMADYAAFLLDRAGDAASFRHPADALTERELEVLEHIATGASNQEIADALFITVGTVKSHVHRLMNKLYAQNRTEAVSKARSLNILPD
jgi:LuxR family maltose regulon positive regulatory protein